jgi:UrcA family protein
MRSCVPRRTILPAGIAQLSLEINMITKFPTDTKPFICLAAVAACTVLSSPIQAEGHAVTTSVTVSSAGLDLSRSAGARELYSRLRKAAFIVCGHGNRVDLQAPTNIADCYEKALGDAVRSVNQPQVTMVYLRTHTVRDAATRSIEIPAQLVRIGAPKSGLDN